MALAEVARAVKDGLLAFASATGLVVMAQMMEAELTERIGPRHAKIPARNASWHGSTPGSVVVGGRKVPMCRPRGRTSEGEEVELDTRAVFSPEDLLRRLVVERMLASVATRRHETVAEPVGTELDKTAKATSKSAISRRAVKATEQALSELNARDLSSLEVAVVMVDGIELAGQCCVVCLVITADGTKVSVGLWLGSTRTGRSSRASSRTCRLGVCPRRRASSSSSTARGPSPLACDGSSARTPRCRCTLTSGETSAIICRRTCRTPSTVASRPPSGTPSGQPGSTGRRRSQESPRPNAASDG